MLKKKIQLYEYHEYPHTAGDGDGLLWCGGVRHRDQKTVVLPAPGIHPSCLDCLMAPH